MQDYAQELRDFFINCGSRVDPGTELTWNNFEKDYGLEPSVLDTIRTAVEKVNNESPSRSDPCFSPLNNKIIHIMHKMEFINRYFCGEFRIDCKDRYFREQFAAVWPEFIKGWYFGCIFVGYGEDFELIDRLKFESEGKDFDLEGVPGKFRLYTKTYGNNFYSILSGQSGIEFNKEQRKRLVKCELGGINSWMYWWYLWIEWLEGMERYQSSVKALSKQVIMTPKSDDERKNIVTQLDNHDPFIVRGSSMTSDKKSEDLSLGKTKFEKMEVINNTTPNMIFEAVQKYFETNASHLGYSGKTIEQKKERLNAGENYGQQKVTANVRTYLINSLNYCFDQMRFKWGEKIVPEDLKILPTNQAMAQGLPQQQFGGTFNNGQFGFNNNNPSQPQDFSSGNA